MYTLIMNFSIMNTAISCCRFNFSNYSYNLAVCIVFISSFVNIDIISSLAISLPIDLLLPFFFYSIY